MALSQGDLQIGLSTGSASPFYCGNCGCAFRGLQPRQIIGDALLILIGQSGGEVDDRGLHPAAMSPCEALELDQGVVIVLTGEGRNRLLAAALRAGPMTHGA